MQMDADFKIGIDLLKRFKEQIQNLAESSDDSEVKENLEAIKEIIRNATYRIKLGNGPFKEEFYSALAVIVKNAREFEDAGAVKENAKKVFEKVLEIDPQNERAKEGMKKISG